MRGITKYTIKNIVAVGSGKGGVGKSTVAINIAYSLNVLGYAVGLLDADIMGPSVVSMLSDEKNIRHQINEDEILPLNLHNIKVVSVAGLINEDQAIALRGAMISKYINNFITKSAWGDLDYMIIDLPPGTGDVQISLCQTLSLSGAIIVTTPQDISAKIALRSINMFEMVNVPILGIIENMSGFICSGCGKQSDILGHGSGQDLATKKNINFFGTVPLEDVISSSCDIGKPVYLADPESNAAKSYMSFAYKLLECDQVSSDDRYIIESIDHADDIFKITWKDNTSNSINTENLRISCGCAICKDSKIVNYDARISKVTKIGKYGIKIHWIDGHNSGIYSLRRLRDDMQAANNGQ